MATNPMVPQGSLNKVRAHIVVPNYPTLNISPDYMGDDGFSLDIDEDMIRQIKTQTGLVNSPEPYVEATCTINLLRTQALSLQWMQQAENTVMIGRIAVHSDSAAFTARTVHNCSILKVQPGHMNGSTPTVNLILRGVYYVNNAMWSLV